MFTFGHRVAGPDARHVMLVLIEEEKGAVLMKRFLQDLHYAHPAPAEKSDRRRAGHAAYRKDNE
jgi:hypothetical protein